MSAIDKIKNIAQNAEGKVKEAVGKHAADDDIRNEGRADQSKANLKQAGEHVKDAFKA